MNLQPAEQWKVQDSSKIQTYMDCPRKYFWEYVLGWRPEQANNHLIFGTSWHSAMESLLQFGYSDDSLLLAQMKLEEVYRSSFGELSDDLYYPKTPGFAAEMLKRYTREYPQDHSSFEVLYTEVSGSVSIGQGRSLYFKTDSILQGTSGFLKDKIFSLEHKTLTTNNRQWQQQWSLKQQVGTYTHVLNCLFPQDKVYGVIINGAVFQKTKPGFTRVHVPKTNLQMQVWLQNINYWYSQIEEQFASLRHCSENEILLSAFPMNSENCTKYFGCTYHDMCTSWANPLQHLDEVPQGFRVEHWDPRSIETTHKMELDK
jgi:hypothetical protein